jgi:NAD(P)-dependent dehydrogenase (short-subunit alcohol dehydrogenase family)
VEEEERMGEIMFDLTGKVAAVSGSGRGIGRSIALALARAGADLAVFSRTEEQFRDTAAAIENTGRHALGLRVDVTEPTDVDAMIKAVMEEYGHLDIMVNNAGLNPSYTRVENVELEDYERIMDVNVKGAFLCSQRVIPVMKEQGKGCIINVASVAGLKALFKCSAYTASKGALVQLTRTMALELAPFNIRANSLCPGFVHTDMTEGLLDNEKGQKRVLDLIPMGRTGELGEIAPAAVFLASDEASYITGAVLCVDGGISCW